MNEKVSTELIARLAGYADLPLEKGRAEMLSQVLGPGLAKLRAIRPAGYEHLAPGLNFRVPLPPVDDTQK